MELLVFLVILFSVFGIILSQYINQYRSAYKLWVEICIYEDGEVSDNEKKKKICSEVESYSRELCEINDLLIIIIYLIYFTTFIITMSFGIDMFLIDPSSQFFQSIILGHITSILLSIIILLIIPIILHVLKISFIGLKIIKFFKINVILKKLRIINILKKMSVINDIDQSDLVTIDDKLFDLWWNTQCQCLKNNYKPYPKGIYDKLNQKIKNNEITNPPEWVEKVLVKYK